MDLRARQTDGEDLKRELFDARKQYQKLLDHCDQLQAKVDTLRENILSYSTENDSLRAQLKFRHRSYQDLVEKCHRLEHQNARL